MLHTSHILIGHVRLMKKFCFYFYFTEDPVVADISEKVSEH